LTRHCPFVIIKIAFARGRAQDIPSFFFKEDKTMTDVCGSLHVGDQVPDFELETFDPVRKDFGRISLKKLKAAKKWTVLFFYPADFTFV
jgi:hypothetical protein